MASATTSAAAMPSWQPPPPAAPTIALHLFYQLDQVQAVHGCRHQDYAQYHAFCTKRLYRIRHHRAVRTVLVHNPKYQASGSSTATATTTTTTTATGASSNQRRHGYAARPHVPIIHKNSTSSNTNTNTSTTARLPASLTTAAVAHEYILWNLVFQAERAWAQSCAVQQQQQQLQQLQSSNKTKNKSSRSKHASIQSRLNKAAKWAVLLAQTVTTAGPIEADPHPHPNGAAESNDPNETATATTVTYSCTADTIAECQAYAAWMQGNVALEHNHYEKAYQQYNTAMQILVQLVASTNAEATPASNITTATTSSPTTIPDRALERSIWQARAETVLSPLVRYCHYEAQLAGHDVMQGDATAHLSLTPAVSSTATTKQLTTSTTATTSLKITFQGRDCSLEPYKDLAVLYLKVEPRLQLQLQRQHLDEDTFLHLLSDLDQAMQATHLALTAVTAAASSSTDNSTQQQQQQRRDLQTILAFFHYQKLALANRKQEMLVLPELTSDAEIIHVYDGLLQNAQAMIATLQETSTTLEKSNVMSVGASNVDRMNQMMDDDPLWLEAQAHVVRIRADDVRLAAGCFISHAGCHPMNSCPGASCRQFSSLV